MRRLALLPVIPISGEGGAAYQPIWADDVARCVVADLDGAATAPDGSSSPGPSAHLRRDRPADRRAPSGASGRSSTCRSASSTTAWPALRRVFGDAVFATWEEAELMEVPMISDARDRRRRGARGRAAADGARCSASEPPRPGRDATGTQRGPSLRRPGPLEHVACSGDYIIPPMSGMPPGMPPPSFSGGSATIASVVRMFLAIEAAFCSAERVTMVGSMTPSLIRSP